RKHASNVVVSRDVTRHEQRISAKSARQFLHVLLEPLALVSESEFCPRLGPSLGNRPGNRTFIGNAEHDASLSLEQWLHVFVYDEQSGRRIPHWWQGGKRGAWCVKCCGTPIRAAILVLASTRHHFIAHLIPHFIAIGETATVSNQGGD